jgi:hypothetical protein
MHTNFIIGGGYNSKHQSWGCHITNPHGNLLYNLVNINKYKILSPPEPTYWPTSLRKKPDILDIRIFVAKIPYHLYCTVNNCLDLNSDHSFVILIINASSHSLNDRPSLFSPMIDRHKFHNIVNQNINLKIKLKSEHDIDEAVNNLITFIHSVASLSNTISNSKTFYYNYPFLSEQVCSLTVEKRRARSLYQSTRLPSHKISYNRLANYLKKTLAKLKDNIFEQKLASLSSLDGSLWKETKKKKKKK